MENLSLSEWLATAEKLVQSGVNLLPAATKLYVTLLPDRKPLTPSEWADWIAEERVKEQGIGRPYPKDGQ